MMYLCTYQRGSHYKWNGGEELVTERNLRFVFTICEYQCQDPVRLQRAHQAHRLWRRLTIGNTCLRRRRWHPTPVLLPGKPHGWRSLVGCSPWGCKELDTTEQLHFHFSLSCIGGGNGNPLQCSCLENPRDGGAWWAAIYGVAQSRTQLKRLSSSSSSRNTCLQVHDV